ncbi:MAG: class I SAM-dependent methyltransferase [Myxococcales bacterium]|nr:class I SAM-dependent methyltransferase [Myxococcales bacterium]MCB9580431.1 class I SAM-dependent methyltransferase [Polyangiaceae bacterium]
MYPVELYDAIHRGTPGDVEFYRRVCHDADSVLELGCGTGRVLSQLDDDGRRLVGVDVNTEALARAREVAPSARLVAADMRELALGEKFARVIAPFNALYCLRDTAELARTLTRVAEHLEPGGTFAADVWTADEFHAEADPGDPEADELDFLVEVDLAGRLYQVFEASRWERDDQRLETRYLYRGEGDERETRLVHRYFLMPEIDRCLRAAGFRVRAFSGGFDGREWQASEELTVIEACLEAQAS